MHQHEDKTKILPHTGRTSTKLPSLSAALKKLITDRKKAKNQRERQQPKLIENREVHKATIEAKLLGLMTSNQFANFQKCGREPIYATCKSCGRFETFYFACNRRWCPLCNYKLTAARAAVIHQWAKNITQPKHLVLTITNFTILTRKRIRDFQKALVRLRKQKLWGTIRGGCCSIEITKGQTGWHLHAHLLLDTDWVEMPRLAAAWSAQVGQHFAICKIKDVRETDYVKEISKYVAKGSDLASWEPEHLMEFINAIKGLRFFFQFGTLLKKGKQIRRELNATKGNGKICPCGCSQIIYETEALAIINEIRKARRRK
jgi:hypothetical protein